MLKHISLNIKQFSFYLRLILENEKFISNKCNLSSFILTLNSYILTFPVLGLHHRSAWRMWPASVNYDDFDGVSHNDLNRPNQHLPAGGAVLYHDCTLCIVIKVKVKIELN